MQIIQYLGHVLLHIITRLKTHHNNYQDHIMFLLNENISSHCFADPANCTMQTFGMFGSTQTSGRDAYLQHGEVTRLNVCFDQKITG